jgi:DNA-directed RNA polymerase alpha subunit
LDEAIKKIEEATELIAQKKREEVLLHGSSMLLKPIKDLELSTRTYNSLKNAGLLCIGDLVKRPDSIYRHGIPNLGCKGIDEVEKALALLGLKFFISRS